MPDWAKRRNISQETWNTYLTWMKNRYGWRASMLQNDPHYFNEYISWTAREPGITAWEPKKAKKVEPTAPGWQPPPGWAQLTPEQIKQFGLKEGETYYAPPTEKKAMISFVPGKVSYDPDTGKYFDIVTGLEMSKEDALALRRVYSKDIAELTQPPKPSAAELQLRIAEREEETARFQQMISPVSRKGINVQELERVASARGFEEARRSILEQATGPRDWITRWIAQSAVNPYTREPTSERETLAEDISTSRAEAERWGGIAEAMMENPSLGAGQVGFTWETALQAQNYALEGLAAREEELAEMERTAGGETRPVSAIRPVGPPAPAWLAEFVPSQRAGQPITKAQVAPPSLQQLAKTPWSQREGLAGYAEWGGQTWQDLMEQVAMMAPESPKIGKARWAPARARIGV